MMRSLVFVSLLTVLFLHTSCSHKISEGVVLPPAIETVAGDNSQKYNIQLDFMKHHFSGMLIVRRMSDNEIRILASTHFGLSLFDFSLRGDTLHINSCIDPMRKEKVLKLLEMDFKQLFLSSSRVRVKDQSGTFEKRISGKGFGKSVVSISGDTKGNPEQVKIKHPWIKLTIRLDQLESTLSYMHKEEILRYTE